MRLSIKVLEVAVVGVYKMSSSCVESLRVDSTQHLEKSSGRMKRNCVPHEMERIKAFRRLRTL